MTGSQFRVRVFGATSAESVDGELHHLTGSMRRMLSLIVAAGPRGVSADQALTELADGDSSPKAASRLRMDVSRLRKRIGVELLPASSGEWRLDIDPSEVDYFALINSANADLPDRPSHLFGLLAGEAFIGSDASPLVEEASRNTMALRQTLLRRACEERPELVDPQVLLAARSWVDRDPLNEALISFVTRCHLDLGEVNAARDLLGRSLGSFTEMLGEPEPSFISRFENEVGNIRPSLTGLGEPEPQHRNVLDHRESAHMVGREAEEAQLGAWLENPEASPLLLHGVSGAGKTSMLIAVAREAAAQGQLVVFETAREFDTAPYATFLRALGDELRIHVRDTAASSQADTWTLALSLLRDHSPDTLLIFDDVQWLDSLSLELLYFLLRSESPRLRILLAGRSAETNDDWNTIRNIALGSNAEELVLEGISSQGMEALVQNLRPNMSHTTQTRLAAQVVELSNGLPGIARPLIKNAEGAVPVVQTASQAKSLVWFVDRLSSVAKSVGRAAAVLTYPLTYPSITKLTELSDPDILQAFEELSDRGVLLSDRVPGYFSFAHALMRDAFLHEAPADTIHELHRRAVGVVNDPHRKAIHQLRGMNRGEESDVALAVLTSADIHYENGSIADALRAYTTADGLDAIDFPTPSLIRWAGAADRLQQGGQELRQRAFDAAMNEGSLELALRAACSGLPEAENPSGDAERLRLLSEIDSDLMSGRARFEHCATLGRQLVIIGDAKNASLWAERALAVAETDVDLDAVARTKWLASFSSMSAMQRRSRSDFFPNFQDEAPNAIQLLLAVDALAAGAVEEALERNQVVATQLDSTPEPLGYWHHVMFASTLESAQGNHEQAAKLSDVAMRHGITFGIPDATLAWIGQRFIRTWMMSGPESFLDDFQPSQSVEFEHSFIAQATIALALFRSGRSDEAVALAQSLASNAISHHSFSGAAVLALCARVLGPQAEQATQIHEFLEPLAGSLLVIGGGFACLGPVDLALAAVTSGEERDLHISASREFSSANGLAGWSDATEREIEAITELLGTKRGAKAYKVQNR
ncbi:MAG: DNA polymerase III delta prime subunit [Candidatus Poriferisodalaceae bacterium]|jgi:DNA polymerase III delta prime subunit